MNELNEEFLKRMKMSTSLDIDKIEMEELDEEGVIELSFKIDGIDKKLIVSTINKGNPISFRNISVYLNEGFRELVDRHIKDNYSIEG